MKTHQVVVLVALLTIMATAYTSAIDVCGYSFVWRNNNMSCPVDNAVCSDVFEQTRNWQNGTSCYERRVLHNCMCSRNTVCPVTNPDHQIYASATHLRYTCQPTCSSVWCATNPSAYPLTTVYNTAEFGRRPYNKIGCRCPYHHQPQSRGRAVRSWRSRMVRGQRQRIYVCNGRRDLMSDPCNE